VQGQILALDLRQSRYLLVNETGRALWGALLGGTTHAALVERLAETFGVERQRAIDDVNAFLRELDGRDLIVRE
jgi:hypothetical protein